MSNRSVHHDTFVIERTFPSPPSKVFRACLTDPEAKARWFLAPGDWTVSGYRFDCRVGGTEHVESRGAGGQVHVYDAFYHELLADRRVVFSGRHAPGGGACLGFTDDHPARPGRRRHPAHLHRARGLSRRRCCRRGLTGGGDRLPAGQPGRALAHTEAPPAP